MKKESNDEKVKEFIVMGHGRWVTGRGKGLTKSGIPKLDWGKEQH